MGREAGTAGPLRTLSRAKAAAETLLKVTSTRLNARVLWIPANPPGTTRSGLAVKESDPTDVAPSKRESVVPLGMVPVPRRAYPYPNVSTNEGNVIVNTPELLAPGLDTMAGGLMLTVVFGPIPMLTLPFPRLYWKKTAPPGPTAASTVRPLTSVPRAKPVNVVSVEPGPNAPIPMGIVVADACGTPTTVHIETNAAENQNRDVLMVFSYDDLDLRLRMSGELLSQRLCVCKQECEDERFLPAVGDKRQLN
jgi:hypothetical protein